MQPSLINWTLSVIDPRAACYTPPADMRQKISQVKALPPLPGIAQRMMELGSDPLADAKKLAELIEQDPLLTAQVIRWASSAFYGYRGKISTVQIAISRVLGFDMVFNLALGLSALSSLRAEKDGPIGTKMYWTHALASVQLMKALNEKMPVEQRQNANQVFLAGLLHNIGFPLLGDQFPEDFSYLNKLILANPSLSVVNLENFALGVDHTVLGAWLMNTWSMPKLISDVVYHHHNPCYRGENSQLNLLTYLSDCLLGQMGIGDARNQSCPEDVYSGLQLSAEICDEVQSRLADQLDGLSASAESLTE